MDISYVLGPCSSWATLNNPLSKEDGKKERKKIDLGEELIADS